MKVYACHLSYLPEMQVLAALFEKGLEFQIVHVNIEAGEHKTEQFLVLSPFGQLPAFEDGDTKIFGSRAITQYIAHGYKDKGTPLVWDVEPKAKVSAQMAVRVNQQTMESQMRWELMSEGAEDAAEIIRKMAMVYSWMDVEVHNFDPVASVLLHELVHKPVLGMTPDTAVLEENGIKLANVLDIYEHRLSQSKYLGCDSFSLADLHHLPALTYLMGTEAKTLFDARPEVSRWVADITSRPPWAKVLALRNQP